MVIKNKNINGIHISFNDGNTIYVDKLEDAVIEEGILYINGINSNQLGWIKLDVLYPIKIMK